MAHDLLGGIGTVSNFGPLGLFLIPTRLMNGATNAVIREVKFVG